MIMALANIISSKLSSSPAIVEDPALLTEAGLELETEDGNVIQPE
jgi:hypothetical protein